MLALDLKIPDEQAARLDRFASRMKKSRDEATAQLIEEALVHDEFPGIEFRDSVIGRQAYLVGSTLAAWELLMVAEDYKMDSTLITDHLRLPAAHIESALAYIRANYAEIKATLDENDAVTEEDLRRSFPHSFVDSKS
jgi:hypothetical protein